MFSLYTVIAIVLSALTIYSSSQMHGTIKVGKMAMTSTPLTSIEPIKLAQTAPAAAVSKPATSVVSVAARAAMLGAGPSRSLGK